MKVVLLAVLIVLGVAVIQAAIWIPIVIWWRRKSARFATAMVSESDLRGERLIAGPEKGSYRGSSGGHGKVKGNGVILLTDRRLVFRKLVGDALEIPVQTITGTGRSKSFLGSRSGGATHLVVTTTEPAEVGFYVANLDAWQRNIDTVRPTQR